MRIATARLQSKEQTGRAMHALVRATAGDLDRMQLSGDNRPLSCLPLREYFDIVRKIPYRRDSSPVEVIARPGFMFGDQTALDCKKKAVLIAAWAKQNGVPYRFIASSNRPDRKITHVFPQLRISGDWRNMDATYVYYRPGQRKRLTAAQILPE